MKNDDEEMREELLKQLQMEPEELVRSLVEKHMRSEHIKGLECAFWLNPREDVWQKGIKLLEVFPGAVFDPEPDFRPVVVGSDARWPRLKLIWSNPKEFETEEGKKYSERLAAQLENGDAKVIFCHPDPKLNGPVLNALLGSCSAV